MFSSCNPINIIFIVIHFNSINSVGSIVLIDIHIRSLLVGRNNKNIMLVQLSFILQNGSQMLRFLNVGGVSVLIVANMGNLFISLTSKISSSELKVLFIIVFFLKLAVVLMSLGNLEQDG